MHDMWNKFFDKVIFYEPYCIKVGRMLDEEVNAIVEPLKESSGCSGSGKSYLANALSKKYNISHFDLDDIQWDNNAKEYGKKRTLDERKALLQEILYNNDEWIIEGVYYAWVQQSFDEADKIYVLDMPGYLYKSRIIMRSIKRKLGIQKGKRETLKSVYNLLKWTETFQNKNLKEIRSILDRYDDKVIWLSRKKDVEKIIKTV